MTQNRKGESLSRLPVPGTGRYEWDGFRSELPKEFNPSRGFVATANHNINPKGYWPPVMFKTTNTLPYDRITRILQVIQPGQMFSMEDSQRLERDVYSLRGAADQPVFRGWTAKDPDVERARDMVAKWDALLSVDSVPAAIYITWRRLPDQNARAREAVTSSSHAAIEAGLRKAIDTLTASLRPDWRLCRDGRLHPPAALHPPLAESCFPTLQSR